MIRLLIAAGALYTLHVLSSATDKPAPEAANKIDLTNDTESDDNSANDANSVPNVDEVDNEQTENS